MAYRHKPPIGSVLDTTHWLSRGLTLTVPLNEGKGIPMAYGASFPRGKKCTVDFTDNASTFPFTKTGQGLNWIRGASVSGNAQLPGCEQDWVVNSPSSGCGVVNFKVCNIPYFANQPQKYTISFLFQPANTTSGLTRIGDTNIGNLGLYINQGVAGTWALAYKDGTNTTRILRTAFTVGDWCHVVFTNNGGTSFELYCNNVLVGDQTTVPGNYNITNDWAQNTGPVGSRVVTTIAINSSTDGGGADDNQVVGQYQGNVGGFWFWHDTYMTAQDINNWWTNGLWQNYKLPPPPVFPLNTSKSHHLDYYKRF